MRRWRPGMHAIWPAPQMIPPIAWFRADQIASVLNRCGYSTGKVSRRCPLSVTRCSAPGRRREPDVTALTVIESPSISVGAGPRTRNEATRWFI
jgi:hypothetical protein